MMSHRSKRELLEVIRPRYLKATRKEKKQILDELIAATGYHRKYAIRVLKHPPKSKGLKKPSKQRVYGDDVVQALTTIWEICGRICSKRLKPFIPEMLVVLERQRELILAEPIKTQLLTMSRATIDRCLKSARFEPRKGLSTTKPGTLLKKAIPVRIFTPWEEEHPGFVEVDLVAHCGETPEAPYLNTLSCVDIATGWTECLGLPNKTQQAVSQAILVLRQQYLSRFWVLIRIMAVNLSTLPFTVIVWLSTLLSPVLVPTEKMIRRMLNRKTGLLSAIPLAMIASKLRTSWICLTPFTRIYALR